MTPEVCRHRMSALTSPLRSPRRRDRFRAAATDKLAITMPLPTVRKLKPGRPASPVLRITLATCAEGKNGSADMIRAAMAAAVGAAAEVPQKVVNPGTVPWPQSAAVKVVLASVVPPLVLKSTFPGVMAVPFG